MRVAGPGAAARVDYRPVSGRLPARGSVRAMPITVHRAGLLAALCLPPKRLGGRRHLVGTHRTNPLSRAHLRTSVKESDGDEHDLGTPENANTLRDDRRHVGMQRVQPVRRNERAMRARALRALAVGVTVVAVLAGAIDNADAALPPGNAAQQWDQIAEDTVVGSGAFQGEGFVYMAYVSQAMHGAVNPGERNGQSPDAAVTEAAYRILVHHFPAREPDLTALHDAALAAIPAGPARRNGIKHGALAANQVLRDRAGDGLQTPIASTSPFQTLASGPGVWRLTPSAYAAPQTPWMAKVRPFWLKRPGQFQPEPPPSLSSPSRTQAQCADRRRVAHRPRGRPGPAERVPPERRRTVSAPLPRAP